MKLWEVLKELEENPKKRFKTDLGAAIAFNDGVLEWEDDGEVCVRSPLVIYDKRTSRFLNGTDNTGDIWQEVKQPVPWQEAIEAWANGKRVICKLNENTYTYHISHFLFVDQNANALSDSEIQIGTWYIED